MNDLLDQLEQLQDIYYAFSRTPWMKELIEGNIMNRLRGVNKRIFVPSNILLKQIPLIDTFEEDKDYENPNDGTNASIEYYVYKILQEVNTGIPTIEDLNKIPLLLEYLQEFDYSELTQGYLIGRVNISPFIQLMDSRMSGIETLSDFLKENGLTPPYVKEDNPIIAVSMRLRETVRFTYSKVLDCGWSYILIFLYTWSQSHYLRPSDELVNELRESINYNIFTRRLEKRGLIEKTVEGIPVELQIVTSPNAGDEVGEIGLRDYNDVNKLAYFVLNIIFENILSSEEYNSLSWRREVGEYDDELEAISGITVNGIEFSNREKGIIALLNPLLEYYSKLEYTSLEEVDPELEALLLKDSDHCMKIEENAERLRDVPDELFQDDDLGDKALFYEENDALKYYFVYKGDSYKEIVESQLLHAELVEERMRE